MSTSTCKREPQKTYVDIQTQYGLITVLLYDSTPQHKENFVKLCTSGYYDSLLFHRVISGFMAQAGDPDSKLADAGITLGNGGPGYTIEAEIKEGYYHKRGALAAARLGDDVNPEKRSSGAQFYIVQGRSFSPDDLDSYVIYRREQQKEQLLKEFIALPEQKEIADSLKYLQSMRLMGQLQAYIASLQPIADSLFARTTPFDLNAAQRQLYTTLGGAPHLDGGYTVFGEVTSGLSVLDSICAAEVDQFNRPKEDIRIKGTRVYQAQ
jgi:cyclophilin family peptidyl-prolyl cis-trans isomerase